MQRCSRKAGRTRRASTFLLLVPPPRTDSALACSSPSLSDQRRRLWAGLVALLQPCYCISTLARVEAFSARPDGLFPPRCDRDGVRGCEQGASIRCRLAYGTAHLHQAGTSPTTAWALPGDTRVACDASESQVRCQGMVHGTCSFRPFQDRGRARQRRFPKSMRCSPG